MAALAGPGDLLHGRFELPSSLPTAVGWTANTPAVRAILDERVLAAVRRWPSLAARMCERLALRGTRAMTHAAINAIPKVELRVLAMLWTCGWGSTAAPSRPSADLLLTTLAVAAGPSACAVVLSGGGHGGATGATAISRLGGTVLATNEATSTVSSMPRATFERDDIVDHVVALDELARILTGLVTAPASTA